MVDSHVPDSSERLEELIRSAEGSPLEFLDGLTMREATRAVLRLSPELRDRLLVSLPPAEAAELVEQVPAPEAADLIEHIPPENAAAILENLPSDEQADLLGEIEDEQAEAILAAMDPAEAEEARVLRSYPEDVAGGLMATEFLRYFQDATVGDVVEDLRNNAETYAEYDVQYVYVTKRNEKLVGVLPLRDLLLGRAGQRISDRMIKNPLALSDRDTLETLRDRFDRHAFFGFPVVDGKGRLVGVVQRADLEAAFADRNESDYLKTQGIVGGEELRTMPLFLRSRRRLSWLTVNIVLNVIAASVIAFYQETLQSAIALAVFLPIISDMSGCSGNQAVAVSMRELSLGLVRPTEALRVWSKEVAVGCVNGLALGGLLAAVALAWKGNAILGLVVGVAMAVNTVIAVSIGGTVPLMLRRMGKDPALASGPILTTFTDICGFMLVLGLATVFITRL